MKKFVLASAGLLVLAACGGGNHEAIVDSCVEDGGINKKACECMADAAKENLDSDLYNKFAKAAREGDSAAEDMMNDLSPEQQGQFVSFVMQAGLSCSANQ